MTSFNPLVVFLCLFTTAVWGGIPETLSSTDSTNCERIMSQIEARLVPILPPSIAQDSFFLCSNGSGGSGGIMANATILFVSLTDGWLVRRKPPSSVW